MSDKSIRKFMFEKSFDGMAGTQRASTAPVPVTLKPEQLEALKKEAFDRGFAEGQNAAAESQTQSLQTIILRLNGKLSDLMQNLQALEKDRDAVLRNAIMSIAKKLLPDLAAKNGLQEIHAMLGDAIAEMVHEPRLVVRIHETEFDAVNTKIHEITTQKAYAGKVVVLADADIKPGDCRVEWADGGIERKVETTWQQIEQTVAPAATAENSQEEKSNG